MPCLLSEAWHAAACGGCGRAIAPAAGRHGRDGALLPSLRRFRTAAAIEARDELRNGSRRAPKWQAGCGPATPLACCGVWRACQLNRCRALGQNWYQVVSCEFLTVEGTGRKRYCLDYPNAQTNSAAARRIAGGCFSSGGRLGGFPSLNISPAPAGHLGRQFHRCGKTVSVHPSPNGCAVHPEMGGNRCVSCVCGPSIPVGSVDALGH